MIEVVLEPLGSIETDAIIRPVRSDLAPVSAVSRELEIQGGAALQERLQSLGSLPVGGAVMTPGGDLKADFVIHAVVMSSDQPQSTATVQRALRNALGRASDWGVDSLSLPALGLGVGMIDHEEAARALVEILYAHLDEGRPPTRLVVAAASEYDSELLKSLVDAARRDRA